MIVAMLAGCGGNSAEENAVQQQSEEAQEAGEIGFVPGGFPISKEPVTIKIMIPITASHAKSLGDLDMIKEYEEKQMCILNGKRCHPRRIQKNTSLRWPQEIFLMRSDRHLPMIHLLFTSMQKKV